MLYLIIALLCLIRPGRPRRPFWWAIGFVLLMLGLSRLANLEQIVTDFGRQVAMRYGWYNTRRPLQAIVIWGVILGSGSIITCILTYFRRLRAPEAIAILAVGCLLTLIGVRSISLHSVDGIVDRHFQGVQLGWLLEICILVCIAGALFWKEPQAHADS